MSACSYAADGIARRLWPVYHDQEYPRDALVPQLLKAFFAVMTDLKLLALDQEDLSILSAHLQDAVLKVEDMAFLPRQRRFAAVLNRFDWVTALTPAKRRARPQRRRTALRFERVERARLQGIDLKVKDRVLVLLAIGFEEGQAPGGTVTLNFAGGAAIRLDVECIEAEMRDLGARWATRSLPDHGDGTS
jgi:hypothetical protein